MKKLGGQNFTGQKVPLSPSLSVNDEGTNIYDLFKYKNVLMTTSSTKKIQERVLNEKN